MKKLFITILMIEQALVFGRRKNLNLPLTDQEHLQARLS
jgi:hypothetical protein